MPVPSSLSVDLPDLIYRAKILLTGTQVAPRPVSAKGILRRELPYGFLRRRSHRHVGVDVVGNFHPDGTRRYRWGEFCV